MTVAAIVGEDGTQTSGIAMSPLPDGSNVLDAAKARLRVLYETHETVALSFSGGKDSLALVWLMHEVGVGEGYTDKVVCWFRDEEVIATEIVSFLNRLVATHDWLDLHWWCVPLMSNKFFMGVVDRYVQWDPARDPRNGGPGYVREMPPQGITLADLGLPADTIMSQYDSSATFAKTLPGEGPVALMTGVRCSESLRRWRAIAVNGVDRGVDCWKSKPVNFGPRTARRHLTMARPIYDWNENDVFRWFYDLGVPYCAVYDAQMWTRTPLRVSSSLTTSSAQRYDRLRAIDPDHFDAILRIFPEVNAQMRYWREFDAAALSVDIGNTYADLEVWCHETQTGDLLDKALMVVRLQRKRLEQGKRAYIPIELARQFIRGEHKRGDVPGCPTFAPGTPEAIAALGPATERADTLDPSLGDQPDDIDI